MKVLVYGWYHQLNIGDDLFIEAFRHLFPEFSFVFTDKIDAVHVKDIDALFIGGGSFLYGKPNITEAALKIIEKKKIFYIGVGVEAEIHPVHLNLMSKAKLIATRSPEQVNRLKDINPNILLIPDLVFALQHLALPRQRKKKSILVLPNVYLIPQGGDPNWKHAAWGYFKSEFCQFLDWAVNENYHLSFLPMSSARKEDDRWAASEIISFMDRRSNRFLLDRNPRNMAELVTLFSEHSIVVTQRFHGIILAEMTQTPYVAIYHHDKLKKSSQTSGQFVPYYGLTKQMLIDNFNHSLDMKYTNVLLIESNIFETLRDEVLSLI